MLGGPGGTALIGAHGTEKLLLKTQVSEDFAYWSESNNIIQVITYAIGLSSRMSKLCHIL